MRILAFVVLLAISAICCASDVSLKDLSKDPKKEIYRFSWSRSFHNKMIYTVDLSDRQNPTIAVKELSRGSPEKLLSESKIPLTSVHLENLEGFLSGAQFWTLPSERKELGLDGATWHLEGIKNGKHHYTNRWSPLPPYFGWQGNMVKGELVMKRLNPPFEQQVKHSDEVGLDMLCLYIMLMASQKPEIIY